MMNHLQYSPCSLLHIRHFLVALISSFILHPSSFAGARLDGDWIVVTGKGNTLESVARDVGNPAILSFEPETGAATSARSWRIAGELTVGGAATSGSLYRYVNSLEFDVGKCGQARIALVPPSETGWQPILRVENSRIATVRTDEGNDACKSEGNIIEVAAGMLILRRANISGNFIVRMSGNGAVEAEDSLIATSNHIGMSIGGTGGTGILPVKISRLRLLDHKIYGMEVGQAGSLSKDPLLLNECTIRGGGADLHVRGKTEIIARDCDFDSIRFAGDGGSVKRQWTVAVRTPAAACRVVAESEKGVGVTEHIEATADTSGVARLVLTEYIARPGGLDYLRPGQNDSTPHRLTVYAPDGKAVLGRVNNYRVLARGQEVRIP
jgi:hypothetical protein